MSTEVDQTPAVDPHRLKMSGTTSMSSAAAPKLSMFSRKSGFVIPKNKLSGSLVPIFGGGKKPGAYDNTAQEESNKQVQRKTKWGPDLTQDAVVKRGRASAYETRVDQIAQQMKSGLLEAKDKEESLFPAQQVDHKPPNPQADKTEKLELLELERREAIGEILKLNPSYKAPVDYKPVMKEATVHIPVKDYPRYNFVSLIFGPECETQNRFEKETGAKLKVCGTESSSGEKVEVFPSDGNGIPAAYEELHVDVSADTYEKVDAAVALIELLITSVSDNLAAGPISTSVSGDNVTIDPPTIPMNQGTVQSLVRPTQFPQQGQFQYQVSWLPTNPDQNPMQTASFSNSMLNNPGNSQTPPANANPLNLPSFFGSQQTLIASAHQPNPQFGNQQARPSMPLTSGSGWGLRPGVPQFPAPIQSSFHSASGHIANFNMMNPATGMAPRPQHPNPSDFMFPQNVVPQTVNRHPPIQNNHKPMMQQAPSFQLAGLNSNPQMQGPQFTTNLMGQSPFLNAMSSSPRFPAPPYSQRNFNPSNRILHEYDNGPLHHPRQWNPMHARPENHMLPNQRFGGNLPFGQQIHDQFSRPPSSVGLQQQGSNQARAGKQENDPEYEDLMASVGVK